MAREALRRNLVVGWTVRGPDHEATIRFSSKAPRQWAHSSGGIEAMAHLVSPPPVSGGENPHISGAYLVSRDCGDLPCGVRGADAVLDF